MKIPFKWEKISAEAIRSKVFGGWVIYTDERDDETGNPVGACMVFVPDPNHEWEI